MHVYSITGIDPHYVTPEGIITTFSNKVVLGIRRHTQTTPDHVAELEALKANFRTFFSDLSNRNRLSSFKIVSTFNLQKPVQNKPSLLPMIVYHIPKIPL